MTRKLASENQKRTLGVTVVFSLNLVPENGEVGDNIKATNAMSSMDSLKIADNVGSMHSLDDLQNVDLLVSNTRIAVDGMAKAPPVLGAIGNASKAAQPWESLRGSLSGLMKLVDNLAEVCVYLWFQMPIAHGVHDINQVHPYVKTAWSVLSSAYKVRRTPSLCLDSCFTDFSQVVNTQSERDASIDDLAQKMYELCELLHDAKLIENIKSLKSVLQLFMTQITECGIFVTEYARTQGFGTFRLL